MSNRFVQGDFNSCNSNTNNNRLKLCLLKKWSVRMKKYYVMIVCLIVVYQSKAGYQQCQDTCETTCAACQTKCVADLNSCKTACNKQIEPCLIDAERKYKICNGQCGMERPGSLAPCKNACSTDYSTDKTACTNNNTECLNQC